MANKKKRFIISIFLLIIVTLFVFFMVHRKLNGKDKQVIHLSGNIEIVDSQLSFKIPGRVQERLVSEGETVEAGQLVAHLDSLDIEQEVAMREAEVSAFQSALDELHAGYRSEEIAQAKAAMERAQAYLNQLLAGSLPEEIAAAEASVRQAKSEAENMKINLERVQNLYEKEIIPESEFDRAKTSFEFAQARFDEAIEHLNLVKEGPRKEQIEQDQASLSEITQRYQMLKRGPRKETIEQAKARLKQAEKALSLAQTKLSYTSLKSAISGVVLSHYIEPGEYVSAGTPIVTVGNLKDVWLRAYINETDFGRVKIGQKVKVTTDTFPDKVYDGYVSFISSQSEFTPKSVQTKKERVKLVFRIKIAIKNPNMELKPGLPADAEIRVD